MKISFYFPIVDEPKPSTRPPPPPVCPMNREELTAVFSPEIGPPSFPASFQNVPLLGSTILISASYSFPPVISGLAHY